MSSSEDKQEEKPQQQPETYYQRKKNWIGGIDNDNVTLFFSLLGVGLGAVAAYPLAKDIWTNLTQRMQQQQYPPNGEVYIPPTEPLPQPPVVEQPVVQPEPQQPVVEQEQQPAEEEDGRFYQKEMQRNAKAMGRKQAKYDSPFGRDIGGLG